ncbi:MAG TPA: DMT family transporter [Trebonia sp.]|nr:DMT family transporter [Trebonia sp.]
MNTSRLPVAPVTQALVTRVASAPVPVSQRRAVAALAAAGVAWGTSVPLSKAALGWLSPGWLVVARFALAAAVLLVTVDRAALRSAFRWPVLAWGAVGFGLSVLVQNTGLARTSVTHTALLIGAGPVLIAVIAAAWHHNVARPVAWAGFAVSLGGIVVVAGGHGGGATGFGDALVLLSVLIVATMTVAQGRLLEGQNPAAVTAVQFVGAALAALPIAVGTSGLPHAPAAGGAGVAAVLAVVGLAVVGTLVPFTLFAYGQHAVSAEVAGAFLNLEPLVGSLAGVIVFGDPAGPRLVAGGAAILAGIVMSSVPGLRGRRGSGRARLATVG